MVASDEVLREWGTFRVAAMFSSEPMRDQVMTHGAAGLAIISHTIVPAQAGYSQ